MINYYFIFYEKHNNSLCLILVLIVIDTMSITKQIITRIIDEQML